MSLIIHFTTSSVPSTILSPPQAFVKLISAWNKDYHTALVLVEITCGG